MSVALRAPTDRGADALRRENAQPPPHAALAAEHTAPSHFSSPSHAATLPRLAAMDEQTLIVRASDGDADAFGELVRRCKDAMYRLALRVMGSPHDADDVVQEAFLAAWRRMGSFRSAAAFSTWMYRIVVNQCATVTRSRKASVSIEQLDKPPSAARSYSPELQAENDAALTALRAAVSDLTFEQRACWVLRELHDMSYTEIAAVLRASPVAVRGRLARARSDLAVAMSEWA